METNQPEINPQETSSDFSKKYAYLNRYSNPKKTGQYSLILSVVSLFIFPGLATMAVILGMFGLYYAIKTKAGYKIIVMNLVGILIGLASGILTKLL